MINYSLYRKGQKSPFGCQRFLARLSAVIIIIVTMAGCGGKGTVQSFAREEINLGFSTRVAVLPFKNNTKDNFAAEKTRNIVITQILHSRVLDVTDVGLVASALRDEAIDDIDTIDPPTLNRLAQRLGVLAFIMGSVDNISTVRRGTISYPEISMTLRLVDARESLVLWQASGRADGDSVMSRLLGLPASDEYQVTLQLANKLLQTLPGIQ